MSPNTVGLLTVGVFGGRGGDDGRGGHHLHGGRPHLPSVFAAAVTPTAATATPAVHAALMLDSLGTCGTSSFIRHCLNSGLRQVTFRLITLMSSDTVFVNGGQLQRHFSPGFCSCHSCDSWRRAVLLMLLLRGVGLGQSCQVGGVGSLPQPLPRVQEDLHVDEDDDGQRDEEGAHAGVDDVARLLGERAGRLIHPDLGPVVPADDRGEADETAHYPDAQDDGQDELDRPALGVGYGVVQGVVPETSGKTLN